MMRIASFFACLGLGISGFSAEIGIQKLHEITQLYSRPVTLLGIANPEQISACAEEHEGVFVCISPQEGIPAPAKQLVHIKNRPDAKMLTHLGESEHFDIVFVEQHPAKIDKAYVRSLYHLGEHVLVCITHATKRTEKFFTNHGFRKIALDSKDNTVVF